jgi:hypothetical protein
MRDYHGIEVCAESRGIDTRRACYCLRERCAKREPSRPNGPQLRNRRAVAGHDYCAASLYFAQHRARLITKLTLCNDSVHAD